MRGLLRRKLPSRFFWSIVLILLFQNSFGSTKETKAEKDLPQFNIELAVSQPSPTAVRVGDELEFVVKVDQKNLHLDFSSAEKDLSEAGWNISIKNGNKNVQELRFTAFPLKSGQLTLPSLTLKTA